MTWLVFSYSLPSQPASSVRVGLWRRLQTLGTISLKSGLYLLPDREECLESFQWLAQEVQQVKGDATIMRVERFEGVSESRLVELFQKAAQKRYEKLNRHIAALEKRLPPRTKTERRASIRKAIQRLHRMYEEAARLDFFDSPYAQPVTSRLRKLKEAVSMKQVDAHLHLPSVTIDAYRNRRWVTRPRPHVDRLACAWLIKRFINSNAAIRYSMQPEADEVRFDMRGAEFGHYGNLCSFETMLVRFVLTDPALQAIAEIALLKGWLLNKLPDAELELHGLVLFQGLYASFSRRP